MKPDQKNEAYVSLKKRLFEIGIPIPGTIHALYARCGSPTCPCATDDKSRHGPYYRWHYRLKGRSVAYGIKEENLRQFERWIENREKIYAIVDEMLKLGIETALARKETVSENSKKSRPPMRGK